MTNASILLTQEIGDRVQRQIREIEALVALAPSGFVITDATLDDNPIVFANKAFLDLTGYSNEEVVGRNCRFLQGPRTDPPVVDAIRKAISERHPIRTEILNYRKDGLPFWTDLAISPTKASADGGITGFIGILSDISARKTAQMAGLEAETRLSRIVDSMPGYVFQRVRSKDGKISFPYFSPSFGRIIGVPGDRIVTAEDLWNHMQHGDAERVQAAIEWSASELSPLVVEFQLTSDNHDEQWIRTYSSPEKMPNGDVVWHGVGINVTSEKEIGLRLAYLADHDPLTGLANRSMISQRLRSEIEAIRRSNGEVALLSLLLVDLSEINETLGSEDGDAVLVGIASRLEEFASQHDHAFAGRIGTGEFAIVRRGDDPSVETLAHQIQHSLNQPIVVGREALNVDICVGAAVFNSADVEKTPPEAAAAELMKRAGLALSAAAKSGAGSRRFYDEELDHRRRHQMVLRHSLRAAIEDNQLELHYQPLVNLRTGKIVSAEALVRWRHPELGLIRPDHFIPLAEESGLIIDLGQWVMQAAIHQSQAWRALGKAVPRIAVNVSATQLRSEDIVSSFQRIVSDSDADANDFELEITEGIFLESSPDINDKLLALKLMGFKVAIDDFGAGHASFQYLRDFPVDKIKIDQVFVRQLRAQSTDAMIVQAIASLARGLNLELVAEGIEDEQQRIFLRDHGCTTGQGFYFSMPLAAEDFGWMIENEIVLPYRPTGSKK